MRSLKSFKDLIFLVYLRMMRSSSAIFGAFESSSESIFIILSCTIEFDIVSSNTYPADSKIVLLLVLLVPSLYFLII